MDDLRFTVVYDDGSIDYIRVSADWFAELDHYTLSEESAKHVAALVRETAE